MTIVDSAAAITPSVLINTQSIGPKYVQHETADRARPVPVEEQRNIVPGAT